MQMNIRKIISLNCGERYEDIIDHRSYTPTWAVVKLKPEKIQALINVATA